MITFSLNDIRKILDLPSETANPAFHGISIDSRTIAKNNLFIAIKGEQFDGHDFIKEAEKKGAVAIVVNRKSDTTLPQIIVKDTINALGKITTAWRNQFNLPLIGVTGSCGKTTLKNMIASILRAACANDAAKVIATEGNFNNNIGLPLNLARLTAEHRYGVIEMGMNAFGEISYLTNLVKPAVAVLNNAAPAHLKGVQSLEGVARAKGEIFEGLSSTGIAILNRDDAFFDFWKKLVGSKKIFTFGLENSADVTAEIFSSNFLLKTPKGNIEINLPLPGKHNVMNALAATAATLALNIDLAAIKSGLENVKAAPGRMRIHMLENGMRLIDDTYNANPFSTTAAINTLKSFSGRRILVLGEMRELGDNEIEMHTQIGSVAKNANIDFLFTCGKLTENTAKAFGKNAYHFFDQEKLIATLKDYLQPNTTMLIKGSRATQMEKVVAALIPETMKENLH